MNRFLFVSLSSLILAISVCLPCGNAFAASTPASFSAASTLVTASSSPGNSYDAGFSVVVTAPIEGDLRQLAEALSPRRVSLATNFFLAVQSIRAEI